MQSRNGEVGWQKSNIQVFWGEIAPSDHIVQVYENDKVFLDSLEGFIGSGLLAGDSVIAIATGGHLELVNTRLRKQGFDIEGLIRNDQYIPLDAEATLAGFMVNDWPDEKLFTDFVTGLLARAQSGNRNVRAFGEMVAILWDSGLSGATVQLEHLWNRIHDNKAFTLFCAYPKAGFTQDAHVSIDTICKAHTKVIDGHSKPSTEVYYRDLKFGTSLPAMASFDK